MRKVGLQKLFIVAVMLSFLFSSFGSRLGWPARLVWAEVNPTQPVAQGLPRLSPIIGYSLQNDISQPLKDIQSARLQNDTVPAIASEVDKVLPNKRPNPKQIEEIKAQGDDVYNSYFATQVDTALQTDQRTPYMPSTSSNFDGVNNRNGVAPSDTTGDIGFDATTGKKYYFQWVNQSYAAWDVTNPALPLQVLPPTNGNTLWQGFGGPCEADNEGDPMVLWDQFAQRWMVSQFATPVPYYQCIAVSATPNPAGAWYRYAFKVSATKFNDYAKFGVWPDGYYASINQFFGGTDWAGAAVLAFDKAKMVQGLPASFILFDLEPINRAFGGMLPADADGDTLPPAGSPNYFVEVDDNASAPDLGATDALRIWKFKVDWANPANSTFGQFGNPDVVLPVAPFNVLSCAITGSRNCIPQPGGQAVDAVGDRLMHRAAYRNFGGYESLVLNHTVNVGADRAGVRWYEVRNLGSSPSIYQQGTFAPQGNTNRWMASMAQDRVGNMALGYSASSNSLSPSIRYTGRLKGDAVGQMTQGETTLMAGNGYQSGSARWGDYSSMTLDPTDDCTFWYANQYVADISSNGWRTRIGAFKFANCSSSPLGALQGTLRDAYTTAPISDARVEVMSATPSLFASTDVSGAFALPPLPGSYTVNASRYGYLPASGGPYAVTVGTTTSADLYLTPALTHSVSGFVTDAVSGAPLSATVSIVGSPHTPLTASVFTDAATGFFSMTLAEGQSYTLTASALLHAERSSALGPITSDTTRNLALAPTSTFGAVVGVVQDLYTGQPLSSAVVSLAGVPGAMAASASNGAFQLMGLVPGAYTVTAALSGFNAITVANVSVSAGGLAARVLALDRPRISISPGGLSKTLVFGTASTDVVGLAITSSGANAISYTLREVAGSVNPAAGGGPDAYGYLWRSSLQNGGPVFDWIDASDGTALNLSDDGEDNINLPFAFSYYGSAITQVRVGNNGAAVLNNPMGKVASVNLPMTSAPFNMLAPFWDDLSADGGNVYWKGVGASPNQKLVIEWHDRTHYLSAGVSTVGSVTFQMVFFEDGDVKFQYKDVLFDEAANDRGKSATVGIHGPNTASFLQYSFNEDKLQDGLAICFDNPRSLTECGRDSYNIPWLATTPLTGNLQSGLAQNTALTWTSSLSDTPQPGNYLGNLVLRTNDPLASVVFVPLTLTVLPAPSQGLLSGTVQSTGPCDAQIAPLMGALVHIQNASGFSATASADASGALGYYLEAGTYDLTVFAQDHLTATASVAIGAGTTVNQNAALRLNKPCIAVSPQSISATLRFPSQITVPLTVTSMGAQPLRFAVVETFDGGEVIGPDAAGYVMVTHAPQTFVDISKTGVFTNPADDGAFNITTTFPISVYGKSSNMVRVGNNGAMLFGTLTGTVSFANSAMQTSANYFIAPLWDDFSTEQGGVVWQELGNAPNRMLVVQWQNRPRYKAIGGATFQVQLRETGEIIFAYKNVDFGNTFFDKGANATVGIRGANSGQALQYSFNSPKLQNNSAICITSNAASCADVPWVTAIPGQVGSLLGTPASSLPVAVLLDSAKSGFGTHTMTLTLVNNSTSALINVPVILTVPLMQPAVLRYFPIIAR